MFEEDLRKSGLTPEDLNARIAGSPELSMIGKTSDTQGYVIPYFDFYGKPKPFYRIRLFDDNIKYLQPKQTTNHIYFPKGLQPLLASQALSAGSKTDDDDGEVEVPPYIILCEGEKKAAAAVKQGFPAVALGGVDSWKNRTIIIPESSELAKLQTGGAKSGMITAKLPPGATSISETNYDLLADGFVQLVDYLIDTGTHIVIIFDSDQTIGMKFEVQRAAAALAFELRFRGVKFNSIHQLMLPRMNDDKTGLDDFLVSNSNNPDAFRNLIQDCFARHCTFPRHPNVREFLSRKLQQSRLDRKTTQQLAMSVLSDLDATGSRLRSPQEKQMFYFDHTEHKLIRASFTTPAAGGMHETPFGQLLYARFGLSSADSRVLTWLDAQFNAEDPVKEVSPHRVIGRKTTEENCVRYQINDGQYVKISGDAENPLQILDNGDEGILFESGQVQSTDAGELLEAFTQMETEYNANKNGHNPLKPWWLDVINETRIDDNYRPRQIATLLNYISPWLMKWRGMQLPMEIILGEAGSGKSSLYEHRLNVITGDPELRGAPLDLKDWHASITNTGGLHVTDNVQLVDKQLRQRLSDELCRIITEPNPHIEMRRLYSNNELMRVPISATFAITAIKQPFMNADILQRSIVLELRKEDTGQAPANGDENGEVQQGTDGFFYESAWVQKQMERFGGRTQWLAHHLFVLHKFFQMVEIDWDENYRATHRLIHFEQTLRTMAKVFSLPHDWIPDYLSSSSVKTISEADWALDGLKAFSTFVKASKEIPRDKRWISNEIATWALSQEDYMECGQITNSRALGRYMQTHKHLVKQVTGLHESGKVNNRQAYRVQ